MDATLAERAVRVRVGLSLRDADPLRFWHYACPQLAEATRLTNEVDEVLVRAPNGCGKTEWGTAYIIAACQGKRELDGVPIPHWRDRVDAIELAIDYKQQKLSTQQTYLRLIGKWPHQARWIGDRILSTLQIKYGDPSAPNDESAWSMVTFMSQENRHAGVGGRADIVRGDEPPLQEIWHEIRKAAHAGRRCVRLLTLTPIHRPQWQWIKEEYGDSPRGTIRRVGKHWAEVRFSLEDNRILTPDRKATLRDEFSRMGPLADARIHGDYIDASGSCPFDIAALLDMLKQCHEPDVVNWKITREMDTEEGRTRVVTTVPVEIFAQPRQGAAYYIPCDPSSGVNDSKHDPGGLHVRELGNGDLVARFNGYIGSYGLGVLAAGLARQYNDAIVDPETTGGWGEGVLRGLADSHYGNISRQRRELVPGSYSIELGFKTTRDSRSAMISAVQSWIEAWRSGIKYGRCPSRAVIQCLLDTILDEDGKPVAAPGMHDEDLILWGQGLRKACTDTGRIIPDVYRPPLTREQRLMAELMGNDDQDEAPFGQRALVPRRRPR